MDIKTRFELIKRNTAEIVTEQELKALLKKKDPVVYLGTSITGRPHAGYFLWVLKMNDFIKAGFKVRLLLADLHGALDNTPWELLEKRYEYYKVVIPALFEAIGADTKKLEIVKGSDFQMDTKYYYDMLRMATVASVHDCNKAASEVVKMGKNPRLAGLIYPIMQALDEQYLNVDIQYGGVDQRKIFMFARENLPKIGYQRRIEIMTPMIPGLVGKKMSSSAEESKIDLLDSEDEVKKKVSRAFCPEGVIEDNGVLAFAKYVIMVMRQDSNSSLDIKRPEKFGGNVSYSSYEQLERDFVQKKLHPMDLKQAVAQEINILLSPVRKKAGGKEKLIRGAYG